MTSTRPHVPCHAPYPYQALLSLLGSEEAQSSQNFHKHQIENNPEGTWPNCLAHRKMKQLLGIYHQYDFIMVVNTTPCRPLPENPLVGLSPVADSGLADHLVVILLYPLGFYNMQLFFREDGRAAMDIDSTFLRSAENTEPGNPCVLGREQNG